MSCDLFVFAGEKSGDLHGEKLLQALLAQNPSLKIAGVGGPKMRGQGMDCILPMEEFQVMGFIDVFLKIFKLIRQFYFITKEIQRLKPKAVITIDYPGFSLRLHKYLKKKGLPAKRIHFICPSVWAWGKKRIPLMADTLDLLLCILPFETTLFTNTRLRAIYVGNPLIERIKTHIYKPLSSQHPLIALFPGSRKKEIERNLPLMLDACRAFSNFQIALSISDEKLRPLILKHLKEKGWQERELQNSRPLQKRPFEPGCNPAVSPTLLSMSSTAGLQPDSKSSILQEPGVLQFPQEREVLLVPSELSYELMKAAHLAIAKSGTVTLELALHRVPTVVVYAVSPLDKIIAYDILRIRLPFYCLVNIIAQKQLFTELIGPHFTLKNVRLNIEKLLDVAVRSTMQRECDTLIKLLGDKNTSHDAAEEILSTLAKWRI